MKMLPQVRGMRKFIVDMFAGMLAITAMLAPAAAQESAPAQQSVTAVRFWSLSDVTRVAVEASGTFEFKSDRLVNPDRIFFDFPATTLVLEHKGLNVIRVGDPLLRQIRVAESRGTTRVVLDLQMPEVEVSTSTLDNPDRLIIELRRPGTRSIQAPEPVVTAPAVPIQQARVFRPPASTPETLSAQRKQQAPALEPPMTVVGAQMAANAVKNDPVSRMAKPSVPPPPSIAAARVPRPALVSNTPTSAPMPQPSAVTIASPEPTAAERLGLPAKSRSAKEESMIRALGLKVGRIVIDAGHGGHDAGSSGPGGLKEKDLVLDISKRLGALVEQQLGCEVVYTRDDDRFVPLEHRTEIANNVRADLFLSIHANSSSIRAASGIETYYLNFTTSKAALDVAARENATSEKTVYDLQDLLQKIALKDKVDESREFASRIQTSLFAMSAKTPVRTRDRGVRKAPFVVLIGATMPSVLAEIGFISNPRDETLMKKPEYRQKIAEALFKGVASYASTLSHFQVAQSRME